MTLQNYTYLSLNESLPHVLTDSDIPFLVEARRADGRCPLDELHIYAELDPILAGLLKHYKDSETQLDSLIQTDIYNAMVEIVEDRKDSAWSAVQTRLLELRSDEKFSGMVDMRLMRLNAQRAGLIQKDKEEKRKMKREGETHDTDFLLFFLWIWLANKWAQESLKAHRALGYSFSQVAC